MSDGDNGNCKSCAEVILREYFKERDTDEDGVIVDWDRVMELVKQGKDIREAIVEVAEFLPGSWLCKYLTWCYIGKEIEKGRTLVDVVEEIKQREPLRYRGCIVGEGIIYEIEEEAKEEAVEDNVKEGGQDKVQEQ